MEDVVNKQQTFFEITKRFAKYGYGTMVCYTDGIILEYVLFKPEHGYRKVVINAELLNQYKTRGSF